MATAANSIQRHYPIPGLNFRDIWDICSHFQRVNPEYQVVRYSIEGNNGLIVNKESDVAEILKKLSRAPDQIRKYEARFYGPDGEEATTPGKSKLMYLPALSDFQAAGLYYYAEGATKLRVYNFEDLLYSNYELDDSGEPAIEFGLPCEVLAVCIDMRGFSEFCEQPNIESPYTCGLMTSFYHTVKSGFIRFQPDMMKFLGDGVLAIWQTSSEDRQIAVEVSLDAISTLNRNWRRVQRGPHFSHGAPKDVGCGMSFGLASKISVGNDYLGRPINLASRLCSSCPPGQAYIDKTVPGVTGTLNILETKVRIKSYGDHSVWLMKSN